MTLKQWLRADSLVVSCTPKNLQPRTSPVFCAASYLGRYYWLSHPQSQHSQNIERSRRGTLMSLQNLWQSVTGSIGQVRNPEERKAAYRLLKSKARTLPERFDELGQHCLRDIYSMRADGSNYQLFDDPSYSVLGTVNATEYDQGVNPLMRHLDFEIEKGSLFVGSFSGMTAHNIHACLFDSKANQGTGIGVYFDANVEIDRAGRLRLSPQGEIMVNGAVVNGNQRGWIDQTRPLGHNIFN